MESSPNRPRYTVSIRLPAPENLRERITAGLVQAVKQRQARRQAQQVDRPDAINTGAVSTPENPQTGENRDATSLSGRK